MIGDVTVNLAASGEADPSEVWERYVRPRRWAQWSPQIRGVDYRGARLRPGTRGRVHGLAGVGLPFEVGEVDAARRHWTMVVPIGPARLRLDHGVLPHGRGTKTWLRITGPLPVVVAYAPAAWWALRRLVAP